MSRCVLGTNQDDFSRKPPCKRCILQSHLDYTGAEADSFSFHRDETLAAAIQHLSVDELKQATHAGIPLGAIVLPSMRWRLRLHNLTDDESTRFLYREFILSAWNVAREFTVLMERTDPQAVVVFNGQFFPEATVRWLCLQREIRVVTHEVGLLPLTGYFTTGEATAYPIRIPDTFELNEEQNARLDAYLEKRFQGKFSMAGIQFWPEMKGLGQAFLQKAAGFKQIVPVFTNVIFDTSQPHANTIFSDMFVWLEMIVELARLHPETLFVIRAHPDETRPGKESQETVENWVNKRAVTDLPNVVFISPREYFSSYELIQLSKFIMIYNSTIGLEASIMGAAVLCAGKARFTQYPAVFFPQSMADFRAQAEAFLAAEKINVPADFRRNARRFLYYQLFRTSLPFDAYLEPAQNISSVYLKDFDWKSLFPEASPTIQTLLDGILHGGDFLLRE